MSNTRVKFVYQEDEELKVYTAVVIIECDDKMVFDIIKKDMEMFFLEKAMSGSPLFP